MLLARRIDQWRAPWGGISLRPYACRILARALANQSSMVEVPGAVPSIGKSFRSFTALLVSTRRVFFGFLRSRIGP